MYFTGITESKIDEYSNRQVNNTVTPTTAKNNIEKLTVGNPHAPDVLANQPGNGHHTVHNPDKPGQPTDTKTNKESQQSDNPASSGSAGTG